MKKVLILGANGMLGRTLLLRVIQSDSFDVAVTSRPGDFDARLEKLVNQKKLAIYYLDALAPDQSKKVFANFSPDFIVNCIGIIKQRRESDNPLQSIAVNSLFPHWLSNMAQEIGAKLVHISTDCVFSGDVGNYSEDDVTDARDLYGRSKSLGEVIDDGCVTLRTSIVGHEVGKRHGLLDWFLNETSEVKGFSNAFFSGVTTLELADQIIKLMTHPIHLYGVYHIAGNKISKLELLTKIGKAYNKNIIITPSDYLKIDRSLNGSRWNQKTGYIAPSWDKLLNDYRNWGFMHEEFFK